MHWFLTLLPKTAKYHRSAETFRDLGVLVSSNPCIESWCLNMLQEGVSVTIMQYLLVRGS